MEISSEYAFGKLVKPPPDSGDTGRLKMRYEDLTELTAEWMADQSVKALEVEAEQKPAGEYINIPRFSESEAAPINPGRISSSESTKSLVEVKPEPRPMPAIQDETDSQLFIVDVLSDELWAGGPIGWKSGIATFLDKVKPQTRRGMSEHTLGRMIRGEMGDRPSHNNYNPEGVRLMTRTQVEEYLTSGKLATLTVTKEDKRKPTKTELDSSELNDGFSPKLRMAKSQESEVWHQIIRKRAEISRLNAELQALAKQFEAAQAEVARIARIELFD